MYLKKFLITALTSVSILASSAYAAPQITAQHCVADFSGEKRILWTSHYTFGFATASGGKLTEYDDGTAVFTGMLTKVSKNRRTRGEVLNNGQDLLELNIKLSGKTNVPKGKPKGNKCRKNPGSCTYYPNFESGSLVGHGNLDGIVLKISQRGPSFQIGKGANAKNSRMGGAVWFNWEVVSDPNNLMKDVLRRGTATKGKGDLNFEMPACPQTQSVCSTIYALHDGGLNDSQLFTIDTDNGYAIAPLGPEYPGFDIEGLAMTPDGSKLYASSGDDATAAPTAELYTVDKETGTITSVGNTGFGEVSALSFRPTDSALWGWAEGEGVISIDTNNGQGSMMIPSSVAQVEDMTWSVDGTMLYGSDNTSLWGYDPQTGDVSVLCNNLPGQTEAIEAYAKDTLLFAMHQSDDLSIYALDVASCNVTSAVVMETGYDDIEGIAWPCKK